MIAAVELVQDRATRMPFDWRERRGLAIFEHALANGVLLRPIGNVVYFIPPYVITPEEIRFMVQAASDAISHALRPAAGGCDNSVSLP